VTAEILDEHAVVVLADVPVTASQATLLEDWVTAGGNLIAMRPDAALAPLFGIDPLGSTAREGYLAVDTSAAPGAGIVERDDAVPRHRRPVHHGRRRGHRDPLQRRDDRHRQPGVTMHAVGQGTATAFAYDLARSVVYTRQGNPAWAGQERDGIAPVRSNDMFYGGTTDPDWVDLDKVQIPQADEQQRLLANIINHVAADTLPLPRFWYFPRGEKAVVDHDRRRPRQRERHRDPLRLLRLGERGRVRGRGLGVHPQLELHLPQHPPVRRCGGGLRSGRLRGRVHVNTGCEVDWTSREQLEGFYATDLAAFAAAFPSVPAPSTHRTHCIAWSDWASQPWVELDNGIRFDTNYYYWPEEWVQNRPGMFTGSGMPMRFADLDGTMIDVYQAATQLTDESGIDYSFHIDTLLDNALGAPGFYGAFTTNMHTDRSVDPAAIIVAAAQGAVCRSSRPGRC
jgi:hypothetical protein